MKGETPAKQLAGFIAKFEPATQSLIRAARRALRKRLPAANELVWDNYNFFVIGYSPTERPSDSVVSIAAGSNGVGLSFYRGASLPDPHGILQGSGSQNRFLRLPSAKTLEDARVRALISSAVAQGRVPFGSGKGTLIIRSVSAKQRPRRRKT